MKMMHGTNMDKFTVLVFLCGGIECLSVLTPIVVVVIIIIIIIIIIIRHQLGLDRPVSASYSSLFVGFPSRFLPFGL
jgi:hypothetical protein